MQETSTSDVAKSLIYYIQANEDPIFNSLYFGDFVFEAFL